jgi:hypothetical protein
MYASDIDLQHSLKAVLGAKAPRQTKGTRNQILVATTDLSGSRIRANDNLHSLFHIRRPLMPWTQGMELGFPAESFHRNFFLILIVALEKDISLIQVLEASPCNHVPPSY